MESTQPIFRWYFAYGSNMSSSVITGTRAVIPRKSTIVSLPGYALCFNILFLPYSEPAMAGIRKRKDDEHPVFGVAYLLSASDLIKIVVTEGAGVAYSVIEVEGRTINGDLLKVSTLTARRETSFSLSRFPSERYMALLINGARESNLPDDYQIQLASSCIYRPQGSWRWRVGRWLFQIIWHPISVWVKNGSKRHKNEQGNVPAWFLTIFDLVLWVMWFHHDYIQAPIFGRGDGRYENEVFPQILR
ncbi:hypothetical protein BCR34DRAFT_480235 [Clohesyomyces aquaticus]|uniref:gamma-glutamylcyclotransferase n=1 Tax=Clohesyomyces aquaticus TaxID=1231657 RepID=A0A1Y1ZUK4_9PLEO|nr:hypothetical protein BCR34DRAFT_480235 [Clohesyomyces aquaticus]